MPFDIGCSGHERDIVQVNNLPSRSMDAANSAERRVGNVPSVANRTWAKRVSACDPCCFGACDRLFDSLVLLK